MITLTLSRLVASNVHNARFSCINVKPFSKRHKAQVGIIKILQRHSRYMYSDYLALEALGVHHSDGSTHRQRQRAPLLPAPAACINMLHRNISSRTLQYLIVGIHALTSYSLYGYTHADNQNGMGRTCSAMSITYKYQGSILIPPAHHNSYFLTEYI